LTEHTPCRIERRVFLRQFAKAGSGAMLTPSLAGLIASGRASAQDRWDGRVGGGNIGRHATGKGSACAGVEIFFLCVARFAEMDVRIDEAGQA